MFKNKDYILDNSKIKNCNSNIAKMNILEYIWFDITVKKCFKWGFECIFEAGKTMFMGLWYLTVNIIMMIMFPVILIYRAVTGIKSAKKQVEHHKRLRENIELTDKELLRYKDTLSCENEI